ncbi:ATP-binding protein [Ruegeria marina]|uniref:Serine/threonine-protein kinase RsbW n=1 Tax=Ruegeria marina TaxID=639004 RepID=A0A1G6NU89_9RHOB|nr:ATP-binding protein [Ruegeria marina]SDC71502.1 serine/threonine-protein kinase RsbW [Ruegeria marina]
MNGDANRQDFVVRFRATELEAREGICSVAERLIRQGLAAERTGDVEIALAEAINNVVEHAYSGIEPGQIQVCCRLLADNLEIRIHDRGKPMPDGNLPSGDPIVPADLPEGGFGWFLIRQLVNEIEYQRLGQGNLLSLRFDLPSRPKA